MRNAFLAELDGHTLESIALKPRDFPKALKQARAAADGNR